MKLLFVFRFRFSWIIFGSIPFPDQIGNSSNQIENSSNQIENSADQIENSADQIGKKKTKKIPIKY